jgi:hypothetical protein
VGDCGSWTDSLSNYQEVQIDNRLGPDKRNRKLMTHYRHLPYGWRRGYLPHKVLGVEKCFITQLLDLGAGGYLLVTIVGLCIRLSDRGVSVRTDHPCRHPRVDVRRDSRVQRMPGEFYESRHELLQFYWSRIFDRPWFQSAQALTL